MQVFRCVRMLVMVPVMGCPPERTLLSRGGAQPREAELKKTGGFESSVSEVSVVATCNGKHTSAIGQNEGAKSDPAHPGIKHEEAGQVDEDKRCAAKDVGTFI